MSDRQIQEAVQRLAGTQLSDQVTIVEGEVTSVDLSTRSCTVVTTSGHSVAEIQGVRLMSVVDDGVLIVPSVGSSVIVSYTKRLEPFVCQFSQVDRVLVITGSASIEVKDGQTTFNDGSYGGLVQIAALVKKLNSLEDLLNDLITKYNTHIHPATSGTTSPTTTQETKTVTRTKQSDLENTTVVHGK